MMIRYLLVIEFLLGTSIASQVLAAPAPPAQEHSAAISRMIAQELLSTADLPALSLAISLDGELVLVEAFGFADVEDRRAATPQTQFRAASVSKVITATALATLMQTRRIDIDAPIATYVPSYPAKRWPITSRQLAGHIAGLPHYGSEDRIEQRFYSSVKDALGVFAHIALQYEPGTEYRYSTHGYTLLSAVIEGAAEMPFLRYVHEEVLRPLNMTSTGVDRRASIAATQATLYTIKDGERSRVEKPEDPSYKWAGGGMISTPSDLVRIGNAYFNGFLRRTVVEEVFTSQHLKNGKQTGVGIGWRRSVDMEGRRTVEHAGGMEGARSVLVLFPEQKLAIALMTNASWSSSIEETAHLIALPFLAPRASRMQPRGEYNIAVTLQEDEHPPRQASGNLQLASDTGTLTTVHNGESTRFPLIYMQRSNIYALIRPDGVFYLTIEAHGDTVQGRAVRYWSMLSESPAATPPFLVFTGAAKGT